MVDKELKKKTIKKKRKVGRPKKRGPKKKRIRRKIVKIVKKRPVIDFKIVSTLNGKQNGYIGSYRTYNEAYNKLMELKKENEKIIFPRKFINSGEVRDIKDEYLLLEKNRFGDKNNNLLRNEYGKFIEHKITNNSKWIIKDKIVKLVEETFWVYGHDPKTDRKTCLWIYENLIINEIKTVYDIIRILIYKNKLIIKYDEKPITMVMCKNKSDCIRLYNFFLKKKEEEKNKQLLFIGSFDKINDNRREIEEEIINLTGWNKIKLQRSTN